MKRGVVIAAVVAVLLLAGGVFAYIKIADARTRAYDAVSRNNIKQIVMVILNYASRTREFPELDQIKSLIEAEGGSFEFTMKNLATGAFPGYEYVRPKTKLFEEDPEKLILVYQIRNGSRANDLAVGYASGSVRDIGSSNR